MSRSSLLLPVTALAAITLGCDGNTDPVTSPAAATLATTAQPALRSATVIRTNGASAFAVYYFESGCEFRQVIISGIDEALIDGNNLTGVVFVTLWIVDNCNFTESYYSGYVEGAFSASGFTSASLNTPITLVNAATGETLDFTVRLSVTGTGKVFSQPGHFRNVSESEQLVVTWNYSQRVANVTSAQLIDINGTDLLADASLSFATIGRSIDGRVTIAVP